MAQPIHCDYQGAEQHPADVLVSQIGTGDTTAWCFTHYVEVCQAVIATALETAAEAAQADAAAAALLEGSAPGPGETAAADEDQADPSIQPDQPRPDDGGPGPAGDEPEPTSLAGSEADDQEGAPTATAGA